MVGIVLKTMKLYSLLSLSTPKNQKILPHHDKDKGCCRLPTTHKGFCNNSQEDNGLWDFGLVR